MSFVVSYIFIVVGLKASQSFNDSIDSHFVIVHKNKQL